jgi:hypothetical protein
MIPVASILWKLPMKAEVLFWRGAILAYVRIGVALTIIDGHQHLGMAKQQDQFMGQMKHPLHIGDGCGQEIKEC